MDCEQSLHDWIETTISFGTEYFNQFFERQILISICRQCSLLYAREQIPKTRITGQIRAQHQGIHKKPDQPFQFGAIATGDRRTDQHILLARVLTQNNIK